MANMHFTRSVHSFLGRILDIQRLPPQLIHQGTKLIPADFIFPIQTLNPISDGKHHEILLSNAFAQPEALAFGKTEEEVLADLGPQAASANPALVKSKLFAGNKPTNSIVIKKLTPHTLGESSSFFGCEGHG